MSRRTTISFFIAEHDTDGPFESRGAIIFEQYTKDDSESVLERAQKFANGGKYGRIWLGSVPIHKLTLLTADNRD